MKDFREMIGNLNETGINIKIKGDEKIHGNTMAFIKGTYNLITFNPLNNREYVISFDENIEDLVYSTDKNDAVKFTVLMRYLLNLFTTYSVKNGYRFNIVINIV